MTGILPIANYLIDHAYCGITNLKLNKLAYYVYGANLVAIRKKRLTGRPKPGYTDRFSRRFTTHTSITAPIPLKKLLKAAESAMSIS